jgi:hypothetical protein
VDKFGGLTKTVPALGHVVIFDGNEIQGFRALGLIKNLGYSATLITSWDQLRIELVSGHQKIKLSLATQPIQGVVCILFCIAPKRSLLQGISSFESNFLQTERERALIAALASSSSRFINPGWIFRCPFHHQTPEHQIEALQSIGWQTPQITWTFNALTQSTVKKCAEQSGQKSLLCLSKHHYFHINLGGADRGPEYPTDLIARTRAYLRTVGLHYACIPLSEYCGITYAFGLSPMIPPELSDDAAATILEAAIADALPCS